MVFKTRMLYALNMRKSLVCACVFMAVFLGGLSLHAIPSQELKTKYEPIIQRNPFGLKPILVTPPQVVTNVTPPAAKTEIYLVGITSVGHPTIPKRAYLVFKEQSGKKATNYGTFKEGHKQFGVEVLAINEKDRTVKIKSDDAGDVLLSFKTHGITNAVVALPQPGRPGAPGMPTAPGMPGGAPGAIPPPPGGGAVPGQPGTAAIGGGTPPPLTAGNAEDYARPTVNGAPLGTGFRGVPSRMRNRGGEIPVPAPGAQPGGGPQGQQVQEVDAAQQWLNLKAEEEIRRRQGEFFPPTPPP